MIKIALGLSTITTFFWSIFIALHFWPHKEYAFFVTVSIICTINGVLLLKHKQLNPLIISIYSLILTMIFGLITSLKMFQVLFPQYLISSSELSYVQNTSYYICCVLSVIHGWTTIIFYKIDRKTSQ